MALTYRGDCTFQPSGEPEPSDPPNDLPTSVEPWIGRQDQLATFLASMEVGDSYLGGYIVDRRVRDNAPFPGVTSVEIIVARPPSFSDYLATPSTSTKTASVSATISSSSIITGADTVDAVRTVTYESPETQYRYFKSSIPDAPLFTDVAGIRSPRLLRSRITASGDVSGTNVEKTFGGGNAPAALIAGLDMPEVDNVTSFTAEPIPGTPWYACIDVVSRELAGD